MSAGNEYGTLIIVDGIAGGGKTTLIKRIENELTQNGVTVTTVIGSGNHELSRALRTLFMTSVQADKTPINNPDVVFADSITRIDMIVGNLKNSLVGFVIPALNRGEVVLLDRSIYTTLAHQGTTREYLEYIAKSWYTLRELKVVQNSEYIHQPDYVIACNITAETSLKRVNRRGNSDPVQSFDVALKEQIVNRYKAAYNFWPGLTHIDMDMNDFEKIDYTPIDQMVGYIIANHKRKTP